MKFKFYLSSLTFLLATFLMVNAQTNTVTGKVTDGIDTLFGVNVIIQGTNTGVITDNNGEFSISSDIDLPWTLEISSMGYTSQSLMVNSTSQIISLSLISGETLDEVVIAGSRKPEKLSESATSISTILLKEIENRPTYNAAVMLDNVVGVQVDKQGANRTNVTIRDNVDIFSTSTLVMLDYRDLSQVGLNIFDSGNSNLSMIDLERVEVVRGPQAALYGAGVGGGVVHYQSKDAFKYPGSTLQLQGGAIANGGSILNKGNFNMKSVYFRHAVSNDEKTLGYKFNFRYAENGEWNLSDLQNTAIFGADGSNAITDSKTMQTTGQTINQIRDNQSKGVDATVYYRPSQNFSLTAVAGMGRTIGNAWTSGTGEVFADQKTYFVQLRVKSNDLFVNYNYTKNIPGQYDNEVGFNYRTGLVSYLDSNQSQLQVQQDLRFDNIGTDVSIGYEHKFAEFESYGRTFGRNESNDDYRVYGAYLSTKTDLTKDLILSLSGRYDIFSALEAKSFSPRVGLVWKATPRHSFRLTYNKAHIPPSALDMFLDLPVAFMPGDINVTLLGNSQAQTFDNIKTKYLFGGGMVPSNPGIGMPHATLFAVLAPATIGAIQAPNSPFAALASFVPWLSSQNTLATVAGTAGFTSGVLLDTDGNPFGPLQGGDKGKLQIDQTYEIGFNGMLSDNLSWSVDVYNTQKENFFAQTILSPLVAFPTLVNDAAATYFPLAYDYAFNTIFGGVNGTQPFADQLATGMTNLLVGGALQAGLNGAVGVIESDQAPNNGKNNIMMGYRNFGKIKYWGIDTGLKWRPSDNLSMFVNYSGVSETEFARDDIGDINETNTYFMNHSKTRVKSGFNYAAGKWVFGLSHKYDSGFNADMGQFYSGLVGQRNIYDTNIGLKVSPKTYIDLAVYNLGGEKYSVFPGMPLIGMSGLLTLRLDL
jgi:iron complex outermembrane receptor protein